MDSEWNAWQNIVMVMLLLFFHSRIILFIDFGRWWIVLDRLRRRTIRKEKESIFIGVWGEVGGEEVREKTNRPRKWPKDMKKKAIVASKNCTYELYGTTFFAPPIIETRVFYCAVFMHIAYTHFTCDKLKWLNAIVYGTNNELIQ